MISNRDLEDAIHWSGMTKSDHDAFSALFKNYFNDLHNFGKLFTNENELISDSIQDLFLDFWIKRKKLNKVLNVKAFIYTAFRNKLLKKIKKRSKYIFKNDKNIHKDFYSSVEQSIIKKEIKDEKNIKVRSIISNLNPKQREVIFLKFYKGFTNDEISKTLNINYQSVKNILYRSKQYIKKLEES